MADSKRGDSKKAVPRETGSYALLLHLPESQRLEIGKLGVHEFSGGYYLYFGSALNGLGARVDRHLRREKKRHWHIDYLTAAAPDMSGSQISAWQLADGRRWECAWSEAASAQPSVRTPARGFGSSDCRCPTHLYWVESEHQAWELLSGLRPAPR